MPRGRCRNGVPKFRKPHHTHYAQRLNISNVGQSARSFQGNSLWTVPDACQYLRALCRLRIPRFPFSGSRVPEDARPLPRTIPSEQQRAEAEEPSCGSPPPRSRRASRRAPRTVRLAPRRGQARRQRSWGVRANPGRPKSASPSAGESSQQLATRGEGRQGNGGRSGAPARGAGGVPGWLRAPGADEGAVRRRRLPGRALVPITWVMQQAVGTAAGPRTHACFPRASSPELGSPSPPGPSPAGARAPGTPTLRGCEAGVQTF